MKIPVIVVSGYLGAGKTTLLLNAIRYANESKIKLAIVMNEFGAIAIDGRIIEGEGIRIAELSGGCVCCSLSGEFASAVDELIGSVKPDIIIVETTGVAEPSALAYDIENSMDTVRLDSVITVVDADSLSRFPNIGHTGVEQITAADTLVLNKIDLARKEQTGAIRSKLAALNPRARIIETMKCMIGKEALFATDNVKERPGMRMQDHQRTHEPVEEHFVFSSASAMNLGSVLNIFESLPKGIYRAKGFIRCGDGKGKLINHVAGRTSVEDFNNDRTELVFIGAEARKLEHEIRSKLEQARA